MSHYRGPRFKIIRRLGTLSGLTNKKHTLKKSKLRLNKKSKYCIRLEQKQRLRFYYGLTEQQLLKYVTIARKSKGPTGEVLLKLVEMRLDNIIFRLGMAYTIPQARQLVNHRHIYVNGYIVDIPSYQCKTRDIISVKDKNKYKAIIKDLSIQQNKDLPKHLTFSTLEYKGFINQMIEPNWVGLKINELLVVEYYSRKT